MKAKSASSRALNRFSSCFPLVAVPSPFFFHLGKQLFSSPVRSSPAPPPPEKTLGHFHPPTILIPRLLFHGSGSFLPPQRVPPSLPPSLPGRIQDTRPTAQLFCSANAFSCFFFFFFVFTSLPRFIKLYTLHFFFLAASVLNSFFLSFCNLLPFFFHLFPESKSSLRLSFSFRASLPLPFFICSYGLEQPPP